MKNTLKKCLDERNEALRIRSQIYSDEVLSEENIVACVFIDVEFNNCQFENVSFGSTVFTECRFDQCVFRGSTLDSAEIRRCKLNNSKFIKSYLTNLEVEEVTFDSCKFHDVCFGKSYIETSCFSYCEFENIDERSSCSIIENSKISINNHQSLLLYGDFDFYQVLKFLALV
jgi:uncharacterized protein YjbI with pentapeptide repeats